MILWQKYNNPSKQMLLVLQILLILFKSYKKIKSLIAHFIPAICATILLLA